MADRKSAQQRAEDIDKQIEQLRNKKKEILQREKAAERKARTHRLVQLGGILESAFGFEIDPEMLAAYLAMRLKNRDGSTSEKTVGQQQAFYYQRNAEWLKTNKENQRNTTNDSENSQAQNSEGNKYEL